jgi:ABC-type uncharacterized transport system involved in gliding motility auxiliary subunit
MSRRAHGLILTLAAIAAFVCVNLLAQSFMSGVRLDATQSRLYTLSEGTRTILARLREPVRITLYASEDSLSAIPDLGAYRDRARALLAAFAAAGGGKVRLETVDAAPFSKAEDDAIEAGLARAPLFEGGDPVVLGLVIRDATDAEQVLPFLDPAREPALEYELARMVSALEGAKRPQIGLLTGLSWLPDALVMQELARFADVIAVPADFTRLPERIDVAAWPGADQRDPGLSRRQGPGADRARSGGPHR